MTSLVDVARGGLVVFLAALLQITILAPIDVLGGTPNLLLVTLVAAALLRGSVYGASAGFFAGLIVDTATRETLGLTSLVLTIAGYWIGRYGETTGRVRALALHFVLGASVSARYVLLESLPPEIVLNLLLTAPVYALCRRFLRPAEPLDRVPLVRQLG